MKILIIEVKDKFLTIEEIKLLYPDQWVLMRLDEEMRDLNHEIERGEVLLHGKDRLELAYKGGELPKGYLKTLYFTGERTRKRILSMTGVMPSGKSII